MSYHFSTVGDVRVGSNELLNLPALCQTRGWRRPLLVTDAGIVGLGLLQPLMEALSEAGVTVSIFDQVCADPPEDVVLSAVEAAGACRADVVLGVGGGSSMDVAKLVAVLAHDGCQQTLSNLYGIDQIRGARLPLALVPTTAGTGSEVTPVAIVTTGDTTKAGIVSPLLLPDVAILDPQLTLGLPASVTAATGIDAMVHAIEAYTSRHRKNPLSDMLAREALRLLASHLPVAIADGSRRDAREACLLAAMLAGQAFANAPVAAVHALAYPLGGHFHVSHGLSNALVLLPVLRFNLPVAAPHYAQLLPCVSPDVTLTGDANTDAEAFISAMGGILDVSGLPLRLSELDIPEQCLPQLADDAMLQQRLLVNNPRTVHRDDALAIYTSIL